MAAGSLLLLLDDIASALDDVALMTKVAASKTAAVVGDDLALNAQQLIGVAADRELRVVWAVARGSLRNKLILVPSAVLLSALAPRLVLPLLISGGCYLCYEGMEKLAHRWLHGAHAQVPDNTNADEAARIRGAVQTDFVLSAEIIIIALGTTAAAPLAVRVGVLICVGLLMTVGVYGMVAAIVKIDDCGLYLARIRRGGLLASAVRMAGRGLVGTAPWLMRFLSVAGTLAMFIVGGGILVHGIPALHTTIDYAESLLRVEGLDGRFLTSLASLLAELATGVLAGTIALSAIEVARRLLRSR